MKTKRGGKRAGAGRPPTKPLLRWEWDCKRLARLLEVR